jgi:hypothetical protein
VRGDVVADKASQADTFIAWLHYSRELYEHRKYPDVRIARRATTIAALARVISERELKKKGLRRTLMTQARRLERLATNRYNEIGGTVPTAEPGEEA